MRDAKQEVKDAKLAQQEDALNGIKTVIFDLDGTLYDKKGLAKRMIRRLWWCLPLMALDRIAKGRCWRWLVGTRWHKRVYLATMTELIGATCARRENVIAFAERCHTLGLTTAIYSDYGAITDKLKVLHIDPKWFDRMVSAPELGDLKPAKACVEHVLAMLQAQPQTTLFVGDRDEKDGACARCVGAKFLLIEE